MAIKDKSTYGEYYWAMQVEAARLQADEGEEAIAPYMAGLLSDIEIIDEMPSGMKRFIKGLSEPTSFAFLPFMAGVGINAIDEMLDIAFEPARLALQRAYGKRYKSKWLNIAEVNTLFSRKKITEGLWDEVVEAEGYEDVLGASLYESQLPYPSIPDLILYSRYHGNADTPSGEFDKWFNISPREWPVWEWLGLQRLTTLQVQTLYRRGLISKDNLFERFAEIGWTPTDRPFVEDLGWSTPNAMLLTQGNLFQRRSKDKILQDISIADINPKFAQTYLDAILTKPASQDLVAYHLRKDPSLSGLTADLQRIGIHSDFIDVYKTLAYPIPPVADIITMAVREAFTPSIAERFGQYEDYPPAFEEWAEKKGLSPEWSKRYWAAHWSLPSAQQGFEMLHRGVIEETELNMLLRALDIMPFWRKRLTKIAYRRLSRVDIRRMYNVGVLDEKQVFDAYTELGYNERDALRMSEFTIKQVLRTQSKFTTGDIVSAYTKYMITRSEARSLLVDIGARPENISFILTSAEYKREWKLTDDRVAAIRNLYKRDVYNDDKARAELLRLNFPAERVDVLMEQWYIDKKDEPVRHWTTSQTLGFIKEGLITKDRGIKELIDIGYDTEHITTYLKASE